MKRFFVAALAAACMVVGSANVSLASVDLLFSYTGDAQERGYGFGDTVAIYNNAAGTATTDVQLFAYNYDLGSLTTLASMDAGGDLSGDEFINNRYRQGPYAYLDSKSGGRLAGLGVGQVLTSSFQVDPSNDDNTSGFGNAGNGNFTRGEVSAFSLASAGGITDFLFRDADHFLLTSGKIAVSFNSGSSWTTYDVGADSKLVGFDGAFVGANQKVALAYVDTQFYLDTAVFDSNFSVVPEPSTMLVWGGLFGLGLVGRRRRS